MIAKLSNVIVRKNGRNVNVRKFGSSACSPMPLRQSGIPKFPNVQIILFDDPLAISDTLWVRANLF